MSERKGLEKNISVRKVTVISIIVLSLFMIVISIWYKEHLITSFLAVIPIIISIYTLSQHYYEKNLSSTKTNVLVNSYGNKAIITCTLKSSHPKRLFIDKAYLFIDSGVQMDSVCKFKHVLKHEYGEISCQVEKKMTAGSIRSYKDINPDDNGIFHELSHLSSATILYLDPNEEFSDECVVQLEKGVYRAMFIVTFKNADCNCAIKHFFIDDSNNTKQIV
ncbi:MAG: hypothetical protein AB2L26_03945 [Ignavibacteria bacterium]